MTEADLATHVVTFLQTRHFEIYQEVGAGPGIADIVAKAEKRRL
jgi:hypothetical protein